MFKILEKKMLNPVIAKIVIARKKKKGFVEDEIVWND